MALKRINKVHLFSDTTTLLDDSTLHSALMNAADKTNHPAQHGAVVRRRSHEIGCDPRFDTVTNALLLGIA